MANEPSAQWKRFPEHYLSEGHNGTDHWEITIIAHAETFKDLVGK